jgi:dCTP deaminase
MKRKIASSSKALYDRFGLGSVEEAVIKEDIHHGILDDIEIARLCMNVGPDNTPMIHPFVNYQVRSTTEKGSVISYGLSSYGYDLRCDRKFKVFSNTYRNYTDGGSVIIDPKQPSEDTYEDYEGDYCIIPPNSLALASSIERFHIPDDVLGICLGKSTYARCGIVVNITPLEPGWTGHLTLEFSNTTPMPAKIYAGEGAAQLIFLRGAKKCRTSYRERHGKYMNQENAPVIARL